MAPGWAAASAVTNALWPTHRGTSVYGSTGELRANSQETSVRHCVAASLRKGTERSNLGKANTARRVADTLVS